MNNEFTSPMIGTVERHVIELKNIDVISSMDRFKSCHQWCHMSLSRHDALTKLQFCDSPRMDYVLIMVSLLHLIELNAVCFNLRAFNVQIE